MIISYLKSFPPLISSTVDNDISIDALSVLNEYSKTSFNKDNSYKIEGRDGVGKWHKRYSLEIEFTSIYSRSGTVAPVFIRRLIFSRWQSSPESLSKKIWISNHNRDRITKIANRKHLMYADAYAHTRINGRAAITWIGRRRDLTFLPTYFFFIAPLR